MKYLAFYDTVENKEENRNIVLAATNKLKYIFECLDKLKIPCEIISASGTKNKKICKAKKVRISDYISLELPFSFGRSNKVINVLAIIFRKLSILLKLLKIKKTETLIVYHSLFYSDIVSLAKKLRGFKLIIEAEEIYGDVMEKQKVSRKELKFFSIADGYIFPTELLNEKVNVKNKPYTIIHGTYRVEKELGKKFDDGKIHVVYAGTFDPRKGGVAAAVAAAEYLSVDYHMHILGFGTEADKKKLLSEIERVSKASACTVSFDGLLSGDDYIKFIQSCDIGLSTQNPDAQFNGTSFPSKILSYMANGIRVVSVKIPAIEGSAIGKDVYYYDEQIPQKIAEAIKSIKFDDGYDGRKVIEKLDSEFSEKLKKLLEDVK